MMFEFPHFIKCLPHKLLVLGMFLAGFATAQLALAQSESKSHFQQICAYASGFEELDAQWKRNDELIKETVAEGNRLRERLDLAITDMQSINAIWAQKLRQQAAEIMFTKELDQEIDQVVKPGIKEVGASFRNASLKLHRLFALQGNMKASVANIEQHMNQLGLAERSTAERQLKILQQIEIAERQLVNSINDYYLLCVKFLEQSDVTGTRCRLENKAVLYVLHKAGDDNAGARLAASVALLRVGKLDEASEMLEPLQNAPLPVQQLAAAIRAELFATQNKPDAAKKELTKTREANLPAVWVLRARTLELLGDSRNAAREWERLKDDANYQSIAQSYLALNRLSRTPTEIQTAKYLQDCEVADELAGQRNWLCKIAVAIALQANQKNTEAIAAATQAADLALGEKKLLCLDLLDQLKSGQAVRWKW